MSRITQRSIPPRYSAPSPKPCGPASTAKKESSASKKSPSPKSPTAKSSSSRRLRHLRHRHQENLPRLCRPAPKSLGHELAGTVVAVGRGVTKWKLGDRVMSFHHIPCGKCFYCERRLFSQCKTVQDHRPHCRASPPTAAASPNTSKPWPWVAERGIVGLPDKVSFEEATFIEPINTIVKAIQKARVSAGETVLVIGCGPIGLQLLMVANLEGAKLYTSDPMASAAPKSLTLEL